MFDDEASGFYDLLSSLVVFLQIVNCRKCFITLVTLNIVTLECLMGALQGGRRSAMAFLMPDRETVELRLPRKPDT